LQRENINITSQATDSCGRATATSPARPYITAAGKRQHQQPSHGLQQRENINITSQVMNSWEGKNTNIISQIMYSWEGEHQHHQPDHGRLQHMFPQLTPTVQINNHF
jgi:hypothetical protein